MAGIVKSVANDALNALSGINVFLHGDFVDCVFLEEPADADIQAFRVLAENHEAHVIGRTVAKRCQAVVEEFNRASIHKQIEFAAKPQENVRGVLIRRNARIAESAEKDGIEFVSEHLDGTCRKRDTLTQEFVSAPIEFDELDLSACRLIFAPNDGANGFDRFRRDFLSDAVAGNHSDARRGAACSQWFY